MTEHRGLFAALAAPFDRDEIKSRPQGGRQLNYVTARTVMNRLDEVLGPENWWDEYEPLEHSVICKLTVRMPDGSTLTKCDAGGYAGMADKGDDDKSGFADAFKRAAVKFGVGRYLYRDGVPMFTSRPVDEPPPPPAPGLSWKPASAIAAQASASNTLTIAPEPAEHPTPAPASQDRPKTGRELFKWARDRNDMFTRLQTHGTTQGYPTRMVDWSPEQVAAAISYVRTNRRSPSIATTAN